MSWRRLRLGGRCIIRTVLGAPSARVSSEWTPSPPTKAHSFAQPTSNNYSRSKGTTTKASAMKPNTPNGPRNTLGVPLLLNQTDFKEET